MNYKEIKFNTNSTSDFSNVVKHRVQQYFKTNNISTNRNTNMIFKTIFMFLLLLVPVTIINSGFITNKWTLFGLYTICGISMSGIGMGIMHDAIHGSYSKSQLVNRILGYSLNLIGGNVKMWKLQHNVLHHTYTNIDGVDHDIKTPFFLRFSPNDSKHPSQRYQYIYAWFFYGISTLIWVTIKDFTSIYEYRKMGLIKTRTDFLKGLIIMTIWKIIYFSYILILPMFLSTFSPTTLILAFIWMHFITGISLSTVFQLAHVIPSAEFPVPQKNGLIANDWFIHQLATTSNFAPNSTILSWLIGGLNHQVEHHLFPNICHIHYKKISNIVKTTAEEFEIPYLSNKSFFSALSSHTHLLKELGRNH